MSYIHKSKLFKIALLAVCLYFFVIFFIYKDNLTSEINNERIQIEDVLTQIKSMRKYVSDDQKKEIYKLQEKGILSHHYFTSPLLSSTYSVNKVNDYYNEFKKEKNQPTVDIRFASPNPRNPNNLATKNEIEILKKFDKNEINRYEEIRKDKKGDILYIALPTGRLEDRCMRCHSTPEAAPSQMVEKYGSKAGFGEELGNMKAIMSIEKPLNSAYERAYIKTFKIAVYIFIATLIFIYFYYRYNKKIYQKNEELELLNKQLDKKVRERTLELNNSKMQLLNVISSSELGYWDWYIDTDEFHVNNLWLSMIGLGKDEFNNKVDQWLDKIHPDDVQKVMPKIYESFEKDSSFSIEYRIKNKNEKYIWVEVVGGVVQRNKEGKALRACGIHRNINQKKLNEKKVQEQESIIQHQTKLAAVGEMLKNISHQWKQPLSVITTIASTIKLSYEFKEKYSDEQLINYCDNILANGNYLAKTINDFSSYFNNNKQTKENIDISKTFERIISLIKESYDFDYIKIESNIENDLMVNLNENIFIQALLNIFNNSHDAFKEGEIDKDSRYLFLDVKKKDENIIIKIKDSAGGIKEEIIDKIFEPYFTTKHQSLGTGIGLYMTSQIINKHLKGNISAKNITYGYENKRFKGCEFLITIPSDSTSFDEII